MDSTTPVPSPAATGRGDAMTTRWFTLVDGVQRGPFDLEALRARVLAGELGPDSWVWADEMPSWRRAAEVPALRPPPSLAVDLPAWAPAAGRGPGAT